MKKTSPPKTRRTRTPQSTQILRDPRLATNTPEAIAVFRDIMCEIEEMIRGWQPTGRPRTNAWRGTRRSAKDAIRSWVELIEKGRRLATTALPLSYAYGLRARRNDGEDVGSRAGV